MTNKQHNQNQLLNKNLLTRSSPYKKKNKQVSQKASVNPKATSPQKLKASKCPQKSSNVLSFGVSRTVLRCRQMSSNVFNFRSIRLTEVTSRLNSYGELRQLAMVLGEKQTFPLIARYKRETPFNLILPSVSFMCCVTKQLL